VLDAEDSAIETWIEKQESSVKNISKGDAEEEANRPIIADVTSNADDMIAKNM
jgi:hypothetical protein